MLHAPMAAGQGAVAASVPCVPGDPQESGAEAWGMGHSDACEAITWRLPQDEAKTGLIITSAHDLREAMSLYYKVRSPFV